MIAALDVRAGHLCSRRWRLESIFPRDVGEAGGWRGAGAPVLGVGRDARADGSTGCPARGRAQEGVRAALVGRRQRGKSSLLNALVGYDRAIVNSEPWARRGTRWKKPLWIEGNRASRRRHRGVASVWGFGRSARGRRFGRIAQGRRPRFRGRARGRAGRARPRRSMRSGGAGSGSVTPAWTTPTARRRRGSWIAP